MGYSGTGDTACVDIDECATNNGGCDALTMCNNNVGAAPTCGPCPMGYSGTGETGCIPPLAGIFMLSARNLSQLHTWNPGAGTSSLLHSIQTNDGDCNPAEGSASGWWTNHYNDRFGSFTPGTTTGSTSSFSTAYAYPKHVAMYNNELIVMSRNDRTVHRYTTAGVEVGSFLAPDTTGQGVATDGTDLFVSTWNGSACRIHRYDSSFTLQESFAVPTGIMAGNNVFDLAWDATTNTWVGLVSTGEGGTGTQATVAVRFTMGGAVIETITLPVTADGIGLNACP
jgi:hypothetical protein